MSNKFSVGFFLNVLLILGFSLFAAAQKIQNVQENGVWATIPLKVDGKNNESTFQAYNKSTLLSYSMSNDDKNLYLVVKSDDNANNNKIMMGGITFTINADGKKKEKDGFVLTYPVIVRGQRQRGQGLGVRTQTGTVDSAFLAMRRQQLTASKEIKVFGFKNIPDSLISIYNEYDISVAANFDNEGAFIYELAIPLNLLDLTDRKDFAYNIKINGFQFGARSNYGNAQVSERYSGRVEGGSEGRQGGEGRLRVSDGVQGGGRTGFDPSAFLPTDFWAKYTLAKK
jgi:hypothetical protein